MGVNPEELLSHAGFVRALAARLVFDEHHSADISQQALLAALEAPPAPEKPLGAWLSLVVKNLSFKLLRGEGHRRKREEAAALPGKAPSAQEVIEREEVRRHVVDAVLSLEEPYRSTLLLRFYEDLPPRMVAKSQGVPVETVKTRLKRGIERLRATLDDRYSGFGKEWRSLVLPIAGLTLAASTAKAASGLPALALGGAAMSMKAKFSIAAVVLLLISFPIYQVVCWVSEVESLPYQSVTETADPAQADAQQADPNPDRGESLQPPDPNPVAADESNPALTVAEEAQEPGTTTQSGEQLSQAPDVNKPIQQPPPMPYAPRDQNHTEMALIPVGTVWLGMTEKEALKIGDNKPGTALNVACRSIPRHKVRLDAFLCDITEVTNLQWKTYLDRTGQEPSKSVKEKLWQNMATCPFGEERLPIRCVNLFEARAFARWCGKRIPTEAEWMRAGGRDKGRIYPWGDKYNPDYCRDPEDRLLPVGSFKKGRSKFGIHDMAGSVYEWTESRLEEYPRFKMINLRMGQKYVTPTPGFNHQLFIVKGGHYLGGAIQHRLDIREGSLPSERLDTMGFRCVMSAKPGETLLDYARQDLEGSCITDRDFELKNLVVFERTDYSNQDPHVIVSYDHLMICPMGKSLTTMKKIVETSRENHFPIAIITTNQILEEPNLPPGSYVLAYRHKDPGEDAKEAKIDAEEAELEKKKKEAEEKKKKKEKKPGEADTPKSQEELEAEKIKQSELEKIRKELGIIEQEEAEAKAALVKIGAITQAKDHIDFPTDKNLILFMNAKDVIVGYIEIEGMEAKSISPTEVHYEPKSGLIRVGLSVQVYGLAPRFNFELRIMDSPF